MAREGYDVTGIETSAELLRSANLRRRNQLMSIRFFQMSYLDMTRFLGKNFYNVISCLDNRIIFINDKTLLRKFFYDCKQLITEKGTLVLSLNNFAGKTNTSLIQLPTRESLRAKLFTEIQEEANGNYVFIQNVENGAGKVLPVVQRQAVRLLSPQDIEVFAKEAGFSQCEFFCDFDKTPFTGKEDFYIVCIK